MGFEMRYTKEQVEKAIKDLKIKIEIYAEMGLQSLSKSDQDYWEKKHDLTQKRIVELEEMLKNEIL